MLKGYTAPRTPLGRSSLVQPPPWHYVGTALAVEYDARPEAVAAKPLPGGALRTSAIGSLQAEKPPPVASPSTSTRCTASTASSSSC